MLEDTKRFTAYISLVEISENVAIDINLCLIVGNFLK